MAYSKNIKYMGKIDVKNLGMTKVSTTLKNTNDVKHVSSTVLEFIVAADLDRTFGGLDDLLIHATYKNANANDVVFEGPLGSLGSVQRIQIKDMSTKEFTDLSEYSTLMGMLIPEHYG